MCITSSNQPKWCNNQYDSMAQSEKTYIRLRTLGQEESKKSTYGHSILDWFFRAMFSNLTLHNMLVPIGSYTTHICGIVGFAFPFTSFTQMRCIYHTRNFVSILYCFLSILNIRFLFDALNKRASICLSFYVKSNVFFQLCGKNNIYSWYFQLQPHWNETRACHVFIKYLCYVCTAWGDDLISNSLNCTIDFESLLINSPRSPSFRRMNVYYQF